MQTICESTYWTVTLRSGCEIQLLADSCSEEAGELRFSLLVDADESERSRLRVEGVTPSNPDRVIVRVAAMPASEVSDVRSS